MRSEPNADASETKLSVPLTPAVFFVLLALSSGTKHGYAVMQDIEQLSDGTVAIGPATLYTTIQRLSDLELVSELPAPPDETDSRRRYYGLTASGSQLLNAEMARLKALIRRADATLRPRRSES